MIADSQTPSSNTGSKCQNEAKIEIGIDWLQFVCPVNNMQEVTTIIDFVTDDFDDTFCLTPGRPAVHGKRYENSGYSARGSAFAWNLPEGDSTEGQLWISLPGGVLGGVSLREIWRMMRGLVKAYSAKATRLDIRIDDFGKTISKDSVISAVDSGNYARFNYFDPREPRVKGKSKGWTLYFGSPQSDKRMRYYDKSAESSGKIDSYRWELQLRDRYAKEVFIQLTEIWPENFDELAPQYLAGVLVGAIDFIDRQSGDRLSRCTRLDWWQQFVDNIGCSIRISIVRPRASMERTLQWMDRQVQTSLAMIRDVMGIDVFRLWISRQVDSGRERYTDRHNALIKVAKMDCKKGDMMLV